ncbi:MAG: radical SAM protein [Acutalibacteraceae bacterium]
MSKFSKKEIVEMLSIPEFSDDYYKLLSEADKMTRREFGNRGYIFAQIGIDSNPCPGNCKFCSLAASNFSVDCVFKKSITEVVEEAKLIASKGIDDLFLMSTAAFEQKEFIKFGAAVSQIIPEGMRLVANTGDFDYDTAKEMKNAGFTGAYHIKRLREGIDTDISPETRMQTIENIKKAGLELYYCIEPIGPEHSNEEIAEEILFAGDLKVEAMAVMRRTPVKGTPLYTLGELTSAQILKIGAITRIVTKPSRSMNIHETVETSLICGINQLYAEYGANPRDTVEETSKNRGYSVENLRNLFRQYGYSFDSVPF